MMKRKHTGIDIEIDELTNSIKNVISGDSFPTDITLITSSDLKTGGCSFWRETNDNRYKRRIKID